MMKREEMMDNRPEIEPTFFMYEPLPADREDSPRIIAEMSKRMQTNGATFARLTLVSQEYPSPPYPHGYYLEGWAVDPARMDPPGKQAPFNFPLTTLKEAADAE